MKERWLADPSPFFGGTREQTRLIDNPPRTASRPEDLATGGLMFGTSSRASFRSPAFRGSDRRGDDLPFPRGEFRRSAKPSPHESLRPIPSDPRPNANVRPSPHPHESTTWARRFGCGPRRPFLQMLEARISAGWRPDNLALLSPRVRIGPPDGGDSTLDGPGRGVECPHDGCPPAASPSKASAGRNSSAGGGCSSAPSRRSRRPSRFRAED
jgi:hypothetical protein